VMKIQTASVAKPPRFTAQPELTVRSEADVPTKGSKDGSGPIADDGRALTQNHRRLSRGRLLTTRARKWVDFLRGMVDKQPRDVLRPAAERLTGRFAFRRSRLPNAGPPRTAAAANQLIVRFLSSGARMRERSARGLPSDIGKIGRFVSLCRSLQQDKV
jgi:hypothetical protein